MRLMRIPECDPALGRGFFRSPFVPLLRACCYVIALASSSMCCSTQVRAQTIWLAPMDSEAIRIRGWPANDYLGLFESKAAWASSSNGVRVFQVSTQFALRAPEAEIERVVQGLMDRHIALAMGGLMLHGHDGCGGGVEGYSDTTHIRKAAERIRSAGGQLYAIAMDGPLYSGHDYNGLHACHDPIEHIAQEVAARVRDAKSVFPDVIVGDIEPIGNDLGHWPTEISSWLGAYRDATGRSLAFLQIDTNWRSPKWSGQLLQVSSVLLEAKVALGIIYNGGELTEPSDDAWTKTAEARFRTIEGEMRLRPAIAAIESWNREPRCNLPQDDPTSLTSVVKAYEQWKHDRSQGR